VIIADTKATIGKGNDISASGPVKDAATYDGNSSAVVKANLQGTETVVRISIGVNVACIHTSSGIYCNITSAGGIEVSAHTHSDSNALAQAGASGAKGGDGASGDGVDQKVIDQRSYANDQITSHGGTAANSSENSSAKTSQGGVDVAAAVAVNITHVHSDAVLPDNLILHANGGPLTVSAWNAAGATAAADGSVASNSKTGIGAAVAVNYVEHKNMHRRQRSDHIKGLVVESVLGNGAVNQNYGATALSGAGADETGIAGSVALNFVLDSNHNAAAAAAADIDAGGGDVTVQAQSSSTDTAPATPHDGGADAGQTAVGLSAALNLVVQEVHAEVSDGAKIKNAGKLKVKAESTNTLTTVAKNGSGGYVGCHWRLEYL